MSNKIYYWGFIDKEGNITYQPKPKTKYIESSRFDVIEEDKYILFMKEVE